MPLFERASLDDAQFLTELAMKSNGHYGYRSVSDDEALKVFTVPEKRILEEVVMLMKLRGKVIGFFSLCRYEANELYDLFLDPDYIGKGYGRVMFEKAMQEARRIGWSRVEWECDPFAEGFYQKMGAKEIPEKKRLCPLNPDYQSPRYEFIL